MKTSSSTAIDWDVLDADMCCASCEIPEGAITTKMIVERYKLSQSSANRRLRDLGEKDGYEIFKVRSPENGKIMNAVIQTKK